MRFVTTRTRMGLLICSLLLGCGFSTVTVAAPLESIIIEVQAGAHDRDRTPLSCPLPEHLAKAPAIWIQRLDRGTQIPVQRLMSDPPQAVWMLQDRLARRQARRYRLSASGFNRDRDVHVKCFEKGGEVTIGVRNKPVLTYHTAVVVPPDGVDPIYQRSGFIHPLQTPSGRILTEAFPADHLHQHGVFNAWVKTEFEGRPVDFWNQAGGTGTVEHVDVKNLASGPVFGEFTAELRHVDLSAKPEPVAALNETWTVRVYDRSDMFIVDLESTQQCATDQPLILKEYHYGGMAFRGNSEWLGQPESDFLTSEGKSRADGNHTRPHWTDAFGILDGRPCGLAVLQDPSNPRFPAPVRLHPSKPYFVYTPVVLGEMMIEPEQPMTSRYRYVIHDGLPSADTIDAAWTDFAEPPEVRLIE